MNMNKNIIKENKMASQNVVKNKKFYGVVNVSKKLKGNKGFVNSSYVVTHVGTRLEAKNVIEAKVKKMGGKLEYFGIFKNNLKK